MAPTASGSYAAPPFAVSASCSVTYYDEKTGKLTEDGDAAVKRHLENLDLVCPTCKERAYWDVQPYLGAVPSFRRWERQLPVAVVTCSKCSFVVTFSAPGFSIRL